MHCLQACGCIRLEHCAAYENKHTRAVSTVKLKIWYWELNEY